MWAACNGHSSTTLLLLENGADVNIKNDDGKTVLYFTAYLEDEALKQSVAERFNFQAIDDERLLKLQRRRRVLQILERWTKQVSL
jgi:ankyrin repeat protein